MKHILVPALAILLATAGFTGRLHAENTDAEKLHFEESACPYTFDLPGNAAVDEEMVHGREPNGTEAIIASWTTPDAAYMVICLPKPDYAFPAGSRERYCGPENLDLIERNSTCNYAKNYEGVESSYSKAGSSDGVAFFRMYKGHKENKGQIGLRVGTKQKNPDEAEKKRIEELAESFFSTVR